MGLAGRMTRRPRRRALLTAHGWAAYAALFAAALVVAGAVDLALRPQPPASSWSQP